MVSTGRLLPARPVWTERTCRLRGRVCCLSGRGILLSPELWDIGSRVTGNRETPVAGEATSPPQRVLVPC